MFPDLPIAEQESEPKAVDTHIVRDGGEVLRSLFHQSADQVFWDPAQPEAADHDGGTVLDVADGLVGACNYFLHDLPAMRLRLLVSFPNNISPTGHGPKPASALMCPAGPAFSKRLPQAEAN